MIPLMTTLPESSSDGYVAAAYIVFFALVLIYVAIMAVRLGRVERAVRDLRAQETESRDSVGADSGVSREGDTARVRTHAGGSV